PERVYEISHKIFDQNNNLWKLLSDNPLSAHYFDIQYFFQDIIESLTIYLENLSNCKIVVFIWSDISQQYNNTTNQYTEYYDRRKEIYYKIIDYINSDSQKSE
ncbi:MAG: hypothetical protein AAGA60_27260, partial [Cyanobacteria bacterium P01_E01_bin.42]